MISLRHFENLLEQLFEGSIGRLLRSPIQPAEVAKKLERAMEENYVVAVDGVIVPNHFDVLLHPDDLAQLSVSQSSLTAQMEQWLAEVAREERYRFVGPIRVRLTDDHAVARRTIQVRAAIVDAPESGGTSATRRAAEVYTRDYQVVHTAAGSPACRLKILDGPMMGKVFIVGARVTSIGRAPDNDLVIEATDISRHHARLDQVPGGYRLTDLNSTNGSRVNGRRIREQTLLPGDIVTLGATEIVFQMGDQP